MASVLDAFVRFLADTKDVKKALDSDIPAAAGAAGTKSGQAFGDRMGTAVRQKGPAVVAGVGALVGTFVAGSVQEFANFEQRIQEVYTLLPDISQEAMSKMEDDVKSFAAESGKLPDEVIPALYQAISAGVPPDNVFEFLRTANKAAVGGVASLETAVDGISSVVNAYGSDILDAGQASDYLFTAVKLGKTNLDQLSRSVFNVTPTAAALGVSFGDVTAALAAMTAQGTPTTVATTQLRQVFVELSKEGGKASDTFREISGKTFKEFIASGGNVAEALALMEERAKASGLGVNDLFGSVEAGAAALQLTGRGADIFVSNIEAMGEAAGATETAFKTMDKGITATSNKLRAKIKNFAIGIGKDFEGLGPVFTTFGPTVGRLLGAGIGAALGGLATLLAPALGAAGSAMGGIIAAAIPVGMALLPALLVAALVAAVVFLANNPEIVDQIFEFANGLIDALFAALEALPGLIADFFQWVFNNVPGILADIVPKIAAVILSLPGKIFALQGKILGFFAGLLGKVLGKMPEFIGALVGFILSIPGRIADLLPKLVQFFVEVGTNIGREVKKIVDNVVSFLFSIPGRLIRLGTDIVKSIIKGMHDLPGKLVDTVANAFRKLRVDIGPFHISSSGVTIDLPEIGLPSFAVGTPFVPQDMIAMVHKGEIIVPAAEANAIRQGRLGLGRPPAASGGGSSASVSYGDINVYVTNSSGDDRELAQTIADEVATILQEQSNRFPSLLPGNP